MNHLASSSSPYLRQHADNPVDWYPWGPEALARARAEDRPIFLSIGYSACHWCHVMAHESFENPAIAAVMNRDFVCIKVDREERPDIDEVYMLAVQLLTRSGGWPLSVFLTPDLQPFYGGTYFPPEDLYGRPGFRRVLESLAQLWREKRTDVLNSGVTLVQAMQEAATGGSTPQGAPATLSARPVQLAVRQLNAEFDTEWGGFGGAPKFPPGAALNLLLQRHARTGSRELLDQVTVTLDRMADGGLCDQLGGGFHRYSTDTQWLVPHFEKMLYDNAVLAAVYTRAWQVTGVARYRRIAEGALAYLERDLSAPDGTFYAAEDADSEGHEGRFYLWTPAEIRDVLGREAAALICEIYGVRDGGNFEGRSILHLPQALSAVSARLGVTEETLDSQLTPLRAALLARRAQRPRPGRDTKVLVAWNALTISAFTAAAQAFGSAACGARAESAARQLLARCLPAPDRLLHQVPVPDDTPIAAFLDDYAALALACLDLYETTFTSAWVTHAEALADALLRRFWDDSTGALYTTSDGDHETLPVRLQPTFDGPVPSGTSLTAVLMLRLARLTGDKKWLTVCARLLQRLWPQLKDHPRACLNTCAVLDDFLAPPVEVVLAGRQESAEFAALLGTVHTRFLPGRVLAAAPPAGRPAWPLLEGKVAEGDRPTAHVCRDAACQSPVSTPDALARLLGV